MTKISADVVKDFPRLTAPQQQDLIAKLQRYVERGLWAEQTLQDLSAMTKTPKPLEPKP